MAQNNMENITTQMEKLDFHHPYTPYDVQEQFMKTVYDVLESGKGQVGILESPTGTVSDFDIFCFAY
jgi:chromosome transmission fidelity protein 1